MNASEHTQENFHSKLYKLSEAEKWKKFKEYEKLKEHQNRLKADIPPISEDIYDLRKKALKEWTDV